MYTFDLNKPARVHILGIGGISLSGLARILADRGFDVSGSDIAKSALTETLESEGIKVMIGQTAENITDDIDLVVYSAAIHPGNGEYDEAVRRGIPMMRRATLLGKIMDSYPLSVAIAGSHGKTTTSSMVSSILLAAGKDPTITVGGMLDSIGGNVRIGGGEEFVAEACEYTNSFLEFHPKYSIITNVEADHMDFFKDLADVRHSFKLFAENTQATGALIICSDIPDYKELIPNVKAKIITYSLSGDADITATDISYDESARASFTIVNRGVPELSVSLHIPGKHNILNALAAFAYARESGISDEAIKAGLLEFCGTHRRFELKGKKRGVTVIDDYAHHPTEIKATIDTAKKCAKGRVVVMFQPHTYSRTKSLWGDFVEALSMADEVVLTYIYAARETDNLGINLADMAAEISSLGTPAHYLETFDEAEKFLEKNCLNNDLLITMGAGNVYIIGDDFLGA